MNIAMWLEESIWGKGNVPPYIARQISEEEYRRAKRIVNEVENAQRAHEGHYECTDVDCIL